MKNPLLPVAFATTLLAFPARSQTVLPGEQPALGFDRITQVEVAGGGLTLEQIRAEGMRVFSTPFNALDGLGDGPMDLADPTSPGGRPSLQDNGMFLRVNGMDSQSCLECHSVLSSASIPSTFAVGGAGGASANAMAGPTDIDVSNQHNLTFAFFDGRFINPPFLFGSGGVELLGKEMTRDLRRLRNLARRNPGRPVPLVTKGVDFGVLVVDPSTGDADTSGVVGVDDDLVVKPFGRKGEFPTVRAFAAGAMSFHFGMQPVEDFGVATDDDADTVTDEILIGELSVLHVFGTSLERPEVRGGGSAANHGARIFAEIGCTSCHVPALDTRRRELLHSFPELPARPFDNGYLTVDLHAGPAGFDLNGQGGLAVPLFSDLKRHDMGPDLAESTGNALDPMFVTARLWGVADTAPYLHDGRATTLSAAILLHGGEAESASDTFADLSGAQRSDLLAFLRTLRTPTAPSADLAGS